MAENVIFPEQDLTFTPLDGLGLYLWETAPAVFSLIEGEIYTVVWDGNQHHCTSIVANFNGVDGLGIGNFALAGLGENTGEPFLFGTTIDGGFSACYTTDTDETNRVAIYQTDGDTETSTTIVLRDRNGNKVEYPGIERIKLNTADGGVQNFGAYDPDILTPDKLAEGVIVGGVVGELSTPDILENLPIELDFSGGNQIVSAPDGMAVKSAVIQKPDTLTPENIADGVDIAGIIGTLAGGSSVKVATGTFMAETVTVTHNLGVIPDIVVIYAVKTSLSMSANNNSSAMLGFSTAFADANSIDVRNFLTCHYSSSAYVLTSTSGIDTSVGNGHINNAGTTKFYAGSTSGKRFRKDATYRWVAIGGLT